LKRQLDGSTVSVATADLDQVRIVGDVTVSSPTVNSVYMNLTAGSALALAGAAVSLEKITGAAKIELEDGGSLVNVNRVVASGVTLNFNVVLDPVALRPEATIRPTNFLSIEGRAMLDISIANTADLGGVLRQHATFALEPALRRLGGG
jgi:hypothetical protein